MSRGDGQHSFGHSSHCYWCGLDGDDPAIERPCDEREHKKPTYAQMQHYECVTALEDAKDWLERAELACEEAGYRDAAKAAYGLRLRLAEAIRELESMRPTDQSGEEQKP